MLTILYEVPCRLKNVDHRKFASQGALIYGGSLGQAVKPDLFCYTRSKQNNTIVFSSFVGDSNKAPESAFNMTAPLSLEIAFNLFKQVAMENSNARQ